MYLPYTTKTELKSIISQFRDTYNRMSEQSRKNKMNNLEPGAVIPAKGNLYGEEALEQFKSYAESARIRMGHVLDEAETELKKKMVEAPSDEAVNALTVLKMRNNVTQDEINGFLENYGDNYQAYKAIASIAFEKKLNTWESAKVNEIDATLEKMVDLRRNLENTLAYSDIMAHHDKPGFYAIIDMSIDETFGG